MSEQDRMEEIFPPKTADEIKLENIKKNKEASEAKAKAIKEKGIELGEWTAVTDVDHSGGALERKKTPTGWFVRYRNPTSRILSGFIHVKDNDHSWKVNEPGKWVMMDSPDPSDFSWMERYPIYNGWFVGQGTKHKRDFTHVGYFFDPNHEWGE